MKSIYRLQSFSKHVLRTPSFPIQFYLDLIENFSLDKLIECYQNPFVKEALFIASPELMATLDKWVDQPDQFSKEKSEALELTLLKYFARMASRCTPFGLFSGCSVGELGSESTIILFPNSQFQRVTQFDMHYWVALLQSFVARKEVRHYLNYYPNSSLYVVGDFYRYVEYKYVKSKREHSISALRKTELLDRIIAHSQKGITICQMVDLLIDDDSEIEEATHYIHELIDFQFLVSSFEATVTGSDEWNRMLNFLQSVPELEKDKYLVAQLKTYFAQLDEVVVPNEKLYKEIKEVLDKLSIDYDEKYLFQTDLSTLSGINKLDQNIEKKVSQALWFLNGIRSYSPFYNFQNFTHAFKKRYEEREVSLTTALDTEIGISYLQNVKMNDSHNLLEAFSFGNTVSTQETTENWSTLELILETKLQEAYSKQLISINLSEKDFVDFESNIDGAPATFSVMIEVLKKNDSETIVIESTGNISAAKLLGRFCNGNEAIHALTMEIVAKEIDYYKDKICAEIVHLPQARTGNILRRPVLRDYEIPYLCNSVLDKEFQIDISDLMVSVKNDRVVLRSKKHNKEVVPFLSNAHNYSVNALPIYHFLADLQAQGLKPIYGFHWGALENHYAYFPRVLYKDVIISKAKWRVKKSEVELFYTIDSKKMLTAFSEWKCSRNLPQYVNWARFDNTLLLDLEKEIGVKLFLDSVKNLEVIELEEFLFTDDGVVKDTEGNRYTNQVILSFYKEKMN